MKPGSNDGNASNENNTKSPPPPPAGVTQRTFNVWPTN
jgi:hypothetical protein